MTDKEKWEEKVNKKWEKERIKNFQKVKKEIAETWLVLFRHILPNKYPENEEQLKLFNSLRRLETLASNANFIMHYRMKPKYIEGEIK